VHLLRVHRRYRIDEAVAALRVPVLVVRGREDALSTPGWAAGLAGDYVEVPGPHTFCWRDPEAWSAPVRAFSG
jgi:pimeloyl-ACP methyl ester carboxylesterase